MAQVESLRVGGACQAAVWGHRPLLLPHGSRNLSILVKSEQNAVPLLAETALLSFSVLRPSFFVFLSPFCPPLKAPWNLCPGNEGILPSESLAGLQAPRHAGQSPHPHRPTSLSPSPSSGQGRGQPQISKLPASSSSAQMSAASPKYRKGTRVAA